MISMISASFAPRAGGLQGGKRCVSDGLFDAIDARQAQKDTGPKVGNDRKGGPLTEFAVGARQSSTKCICAGPAGAWTIKRDTHGSTAGQVPRGRRSAHAPGHVGSNQDGVGVVNILGVRALGRIVTVRIDGIRLCGEACAPSGAQLEVGGGLCR